MSGTHCYVPQYINRGNGHVITIIFFKRKSKLFIHFFFLILWLFDFSGILLLLVLQAAVIGFTNLFQSIGVTMHVVIN